MVSLICTIPLLLSTPLVAECSGPQMEYFEGWESSWIEHAREIQDRVIWEPFLENADWKGASACDRLAA